MSSALKVVQIYFKGVDEMKFSVIIMAVMSILAIISTWISGMLIINQEGVLAILARSFNIHEMQAISTLIFVITTLLLVIIREINNENQRAGEHQEGSNS
jgi:hypothetical protein